MRTGKYSFTKKALGSTYKNIHSTKHTSMKTNAGYVNNEK